MKIPSKLKIGGHTYKVVFKEMEEDCGKADRYKGEIWIDEKLMQSEKEATLIHEILHILNGGLSEATVDGLSCQLHQVLTDNLLK